MVELAHHHRLPAARAWLALLFLIAAYLAFSPIEDAIYKPLASRFGLHIIADGAMQPSAFATLMIVRLALDCVLVAGVIAILGLRLRGFPLVGPGVMRLTAIGLATGLIVMTGAILAIIVTGNARAVASAQSPAVAIIHGVGWLLSDYIGAAGEELFGRVALLLVAERFVGWRGAAIVSGLVFAAMHLGNNGASTIWLIRLFCQGVLLSYAVYRTGSVWWSIDYHTGWNWASAPLFGAAGSGYFDAGHLLEFFPEGPVWITGGAVGPEGSVFAFVAVLGALGMLWLTTRDRRMQDWRRRDGVALA